MPLSAGAASMEQVERNKINRPKPNSNFVFKALSFFILSTFREPEMFPIYTTVYNRARHRYLMKSLANTYGTRVSVVKFVRSPRQGRRSANDSKFWFPFTTSL